MSTLKTIQLVDGDGAFQGEQLDSFADEIKLAEKRKDYQVVAIMGPQSSGKSTLLNYVFGTQFVMMDAMTGRSQTTKGIWMTKSPKLTDTTTLVMDLEGNDGRERGEDDTNFERQTALFALSTADVLLVNVWCHDIGREQGSGKPLLRTIFQVNLKLFAPEPNRKKTVLLFVIRDKTKTPVNKLVEVLEADLTKMWEGISKPSQYTDSKITDFFDVQYAALSHFDEKFEDFQADCTVLRRRFTDEVDDSLMRLEDNRLPGDAFSLSCRSIWDVIRSQKDLNLPAHKIMVANIRCAEIKNDQLKALQSDPLWDSLSRDSTAGALMPGFGKLAQGLADSCITGYDTEASYFDPAVSKEKKVELEEKLMALLEPLVKAQIAALTVSLIGELHKDLKVGIANAASADTPAEGSKKKGFAYMSGLARSTALTNFHHLYETELLVSGTPWTGKAELSIFNSAVDNHIAAVRGECVKEATSRAEKQVCKLVSGTVISLLDSCKTGLWPQLHAVAVDASSSAERSLMKALSGFELTASETQALSKQLTASANLRLETHVREAAHTRNSRMKDRFQEVFTLDASKTPRMWGPRDNIPAIARESRLAAAHVLAQLAVIRRASLSATSGTGEPQPDAIELSVLQLAKADLEVNGAASSQDFTELARSSSIGGTQVVDILSAASWPESVREEDVLLQPHEVRTAWREFMSTSNVHVQQALSAQHANKLANNRLPPLWAIVAMLVLGWNEAMAVLFNPMLLIAGVLLLLFVRTLYFELDVDSEMQKGALPGAISLSHKFVPACKAVVGKTVETITNLASSGEGSGERSTSYRVPESQMTNMSAGGASSTSAGASSAGLTQRKPNGGRDGL